MKRILSMALILTMLLSLMLPTTAYAETLKSFKGSVRINGKVAALINKPAVINDTIVIPVNIFKELGNGTVTQKGNDITVKLGTTTYAFKVGSANYTTGGKQFKMNISVRSINKTSYMSLKTACDLMKIKVEYDTKKLVLNFIPPVTVVKPTATPTPVKVTATPTPTKAVAKNVTRAEFIKQLIEVMKYELLPAGESFTDLKGHSVNRHVETALANGVLIKGEVGERFKPNEGITRLDMALMVARAFKLKGDEGRNPFGDITQPNPYLTELYNKTLINTYKEGPYVMFRPGAVLTQEDSKIVFRFITDYIAKVGAGNKVLLPTAEMKKRLMAYTEDLNDEIFGKRTFKQVQIEFIEYMKTQPEGLEWITNRFLQLSRDWMELDWNVDYRDMTGYEERAEKLVSKSFFHNNIPTYMKNYEKYKIVLTTKFYTDESLLYTYNGQNFVRGTIRFMCGDSISKEVTNTIIDITTGKPIMPNKWYEADVVLSIGRDALSRKNGFRVEKFRWLNNKKVFPVK